MRPSAKWLVAPCVALVFAASVVALGAPVRVAEIAAVTPEDARSEVERHAAGHPWVLVGDTAFLFEESARPAADARSQQIPGFFLAQGRNLPAELTSFGIEYAHGFTLLFFPDGLPAAIAPVIDAHGHVLCRVFDGKLIPAEHGQVLLERFVPEPATSEARGGGLTLAQVQALVDQVDQDRYYNTIASLAGFGRRNTHSAEVVTARNWLVTEFQGLGLTVTTPSFTVGASTAWNVVATQTGSILPAETVIVGAHYDSLPSNPANSPGAEDNASGSAGVLEIARILAPFGSQRTIIYICFGGEEQGLRGSQNYVNNMTAMQEANLQGAVIMDMVSYRATATNTVLLESNTFSIPLRNVMGQAASDFTGLAVFTSNFPFGSDHMPFINGGMMSVLAIENDWDVYPAYHQSTDTIAQITREQGAEIVRMNVGAVARLANPNPVPVGLSGFTVE